MISRSIDRKFDDITSYLDDIRCELIEKDEEIDRLTTERDTLASELEEVKANYLKLKRRI